MSNNNQLTTYLNNQSVKDSIKNALGSYSQQFTASVIAIANTNPKLQECDRKSLLSACLTAATLDLPINQNLGFAYIIPYKLKNGDMVAQFQMGYKGFIQLAQRSNQFLTINATDVRENELKRIDRLTGELQFDWIDNDRQKAKTIGYVAYMKLQNGFEKALYMSIDDLKNHGVKYSQTYKRGYGMWKDEFDAMAKKTVIKLLLSKYAPMTTQMQKAQLADQAIIDDDNYKYVDNKPVNPEQVAQEKEEARILKHIKMSKTLEDLEKCKDYIKNEGIMRKYKSKQKELETIANE